jgi:two-component system phosphate regulon sensor histidine kinase PhoR
MNAPRLGITYLFLALVTLGLLLTFEGTGARAGIAIGAITLCLLLNLATRRNMKQKGEERLQREESVFKERERRLIADKGKIESVLDLLDQGVILTDRQGKVIWMNRRAEVMLRTQGGGEGKSFMEVMPHHEAFECLKKCLERGKGEEREIRERGNFFQVKTVPLRLDDEVRGLVMLNDYTSIRRMERARQKLISDISHELRTPITSVKALVETLLDGALSDIEAASSFLEQANSELDRLTKLVSELLELSRIESGEMPFRFKEQDITGIIQKAVDRFGFQLDMMELRPTLDIPLSPPVIADAERIEEVMANLLTNALKFSPAPGDITIKARNDDKFITVSVADTGEGISSSDLPHIFERFYKADKSRGGAGSGLGLSICKHIVQAHGGKIWVESVEGEGSTFYFTIPLASPSAVDVK